MKRAFIVLFAVAAGLMLAVAGCQDKPAAPPETSAAPSPMEPAMGQQQHPPITATGMGGVEAPAAGSIAKVEGGKTVGEVYAGKADLAGQKVKVKGKVMKVSQQIMGRNWIHVQDGTGDAGTNDLTVTSTDTATVGDVVVVEGTLAVDKDFGAGYTYAVILEEATVTVDQ